MQAIQWGIIGCGDVTEVKSGPAFNKVSNSSLVAVMRRDAAKAEDYARRHGVPKWYSDASKLIHDPDVNAVYVATPPSSHEEYAIAALQAGKPVYVEKPMSVDTASAKRIAEAAKKYGQKLVVAHYRRAQPLFSKIKQLLDEKLIGDTRFARLEIYKKMLLPEELVHPSRGWRVNREIGGGGIFHDLAPHQLDLMYHFFGEPIKVAGVSQNQSKQYDADDIVAGNIVFRSGVVFNGLWCFTVAKEEERDHCEIIGERGKIGFSFFDHKPVEVTVDGKTETLVFDPLPHVQQPMIEKVVNFFLDKGPNPCSGEEGVNVMRMIDQFTSHS
ncbi:MAG: Gfo/Idh/MocA family oxidoreductase [Chitinophagaceae bacterium]|nr:Gfo/Idh/MocA family oxidoreductase [Chitinophagaceae bacterium]